MSILKRKSSGFNWLIAWIIEDRMFLRTFESLPKFSKDYHPNQKWIFKEQACTLSTSSCEGSILWAFSTTCSCSVTACCIWERLSSRNRCLSSVEVVWLARILWSNIINRGKTKWGYVSEKTNTEWYWVYKTTLGLIQEPLQTNSFLFRRYFLARIFS